MNFLEKLLGPTKSDKLGIDAAIAGLKSLSLRLESEKQKLSDVKQQLRDQALKDPDGDIDEMPLIRQKDRITVFEDALEEATHKAAASIDSRTADLDEQIALLEQQREDLHRKRDLERLAAVKAFCAATDSRITQMPTHGRGGTINVVSVSVMTNDEVAEFFKEMPEPKTSKLGLELEAVVKELQRLSLIKRSGSRTGLEALLLTG